MTGEQGRKISRRASRRIASRPPMRSIIEGTFEGDAFILKSDVNDFITSLEKSFSDWTDKVEAGEGKKI